VAPRSEDPKLIIRVINFELTQHTDGQTDRRTDGQLTASNTALALRASRGNSTKLGGLLFGHPACLIQQGKRLFLKIVTDHCDCCSKMKTVMQ